MSPTGIGTELAVRSTYETQTLRRPLPEFEIVDPEVFRDIPHMVTYGESRRIVQSPTDFSGDDLLSGNFGSSAESLHYTYCGHPLDGSPWAWIEQQQFLAASRLASVEHHLGLRSLLTFASDSLGQVKQPAKQPLPYMLAPQTPGEAIAGLYDDYPVITFASNRPESPLIGMIKTSEALLQSWRPQDSYGHERPPSEYYQMKQALGYLSYLGFAMTDLEFHIGPSVHFESFPGPDQIDIPHFVRYQLSDRGYNEEFIHVPDQHINTSRLDTAASPEQFSRLGNFGRIRGHNLALIALHAA